MLNMIIFISLDDFKQILDNYIKAVFDPGVIHLHRSRTSLGLIKARNLGVRLASGNIIVSMDSHMEVQDYWCVHVV